MVQSMPSASGCNSGMFNFRFSNPEVETEAEASDESMCVGVCFGAA